MSGSSDYNPSVARYTGYASYGIDQIASEQEATGWQSFNDGLNGELYWSVNQPTSTSLNTANTGLTGDGTLFYPYNADAGRRYDVDPAGVDPAQAHPQRPPGLRTSAPGRSPGPGARRRPHRPQHLHDAVPGPARQRREPDCARRGRAGHLPALPVPVRYRRSGSSSTPTTWTATARPDFIAVQAGTGKLLFYPRTATDWTPNAPITVGTGFGTSASTLTYTSLLLPGDLNGDGSPDLVGRKSDGSMWLMPGNCTGTFGAAQKLTSTTAAPVSVGDFNGDGHADLLDKHADGTVWMLAGTGQGGFTAPVQVGAGWSALQMVGYRGRQRRRRGRHHRSAE